MVGVVGSSPIAPTNFPGTATPAPDFFLLAHSHGVALLDAISDWRSRVDRNVAPDPRHGAAFQGWSQGAIPASPFEASVTRPGLTSRRFVVWVLWAKEKIGRLVTQVETAPGTIAAQINPLFHEVLLAWRGEAPIVSMMHGNEHARAMLNVWPPYDFFDAEDPGVRPDVPVIDAAFIDERIDAWCGEVFLPLSVLRHIAPNPLVHVLPPPPREHPERASHFEELQELVARHGFAPDSLRLKWYRRYCSRLSAQLEAIGCAVLRPPAEACAQSGLLREEFAEGLSHGNAAYGALTARQIESWMRGARA